MWFIICSFQDSCIWTWRMEAGRDGDDLWWWRYERLTKVRPDDATWGDALPPPKLV